MWFIKSKTENLCGERESAPPFMFKDEFIRYYALRLHNTGIIVFSFVDVYIFGLGVFATINIVFGLVGHQHMQNTVYI